ncbi:MAG: FAD-dependent oxidoreductase [Jiangellaceae bacterium]
MGGGSADAVVVGAGVIGLTTGICLAEAGVRTRILTAEPPHRTTSYAASAMCGPIFLPADDPGGAREHASYDVFSALARMPESGVHMCGGRFVASGEMPVAPAIHRPDDVRPLDAGELPAGYSSGFAATVPCVDMPRYLGYLTGRFEDAGGTVEIRRLSTLTEAAGTARLVANCSGVGARDLVPDHAVRPVRGQHVVVENPGIDTLFMEPPFGAAWTGWHPHGDIVVLGGIAVEDDWNLEPDPAVTEQILRRCIVVEPRFRDARVVEHRVGLRPGRPTVRLEREDVDGVRIVHDYGHGGTGVMLSWACAREAAALLTA